MARKTKDVVIEKEGRDKAKVFRITEMSAARSEKWAFRALQALAASGVKLPDNYNDVPLSRLAGLGLEALARVDFEIAEQLLDEMMECVQVLPPNGLPRKVMTENDIEEMSTLFDLRKEVVSLHVGFFTEGQSQITG